MKKLLFVITIILSTYLPIYAQDDPLPKPAVDPSLPVIIVADDSSSGTYKLFMKEIMNETNDSVTFQELGNKGGAVGNLQALLDNKASAAFMHSDVLQFKEQSDPTIAPRFRTLLALYSEDVHFVSLTQSKHTVSNGWSLSRKYANLNTIDDLTQGFKVGAAGGGYITIQVIKSLVGLGYQVVKFDSGDQVLAALNNGDIDCAVFVGGAPLPNLANLDSNYKLLSVPDTDVTRLASVYHVTNITYTGMSPTSTSTVAADCLLVARNYKTAKYIQPLDKFRQEFYTKLSDLQESVGNQPKWMEVTPNNRGKLPWLHLPTDKPSPEDVDSQ